MYYINSDPHGDYRKIDAFCHRMKLTKDDTIILCGDVGTNYFGNNKDKERKEWLKSLPCQFLCIHGNHERRPHTLQQYEWREYCGGEVWVEPEYPSIMFAKDGEVYNLDGCKCMALGGAYSVDKQYRLRMGYYWFEDEQPSDEIKTYVEEQLDRYNWNIDYVFSHTCPICYEPIEVFMSGIDQRTVDKTTERWLGNIEYRLQYKKWYVGHFHTDKSIDKMRFLYNDFVKLGE